MKIAFVSQPFTKIDPDLRVIGSSMILLTYELARRLTKKHEVTVYSYCKFWKRLKYCEGVKYQYLPAAFDKIWSKILKLFFNNSDIKNPLFLSRFLAPIYAFEIAKDLRKNQYDIVHIHNFSQFIPSIRALNPKITIVLHMHCEWLTQLNDATIEQRLNQVDFVVTCSEYITEKIRKHFPQFAKRCHTVYNGVDIDRFVLKSDLSETSTDRKRRLLYVGRVSPDKGVHILLEAFAKVVERYPGVQLEIVGPQKAAKYERVFALSDDPKVLELASFYENGQPTGWTNYLSNWQNTSSAASQVSFLGQLPSSQVVDYYKNADLLIFPSVWHEPFGIPIVEAMATGVPVVATRSGAFPELVEDGKTGLLVERGDVSGLAEAILNLLHNEDLRKSMGKAGRQQTIERFSWERIVEDLQYHYKGS